MLPRHLITIPLHFLIPRHSVRRQREESSGGIADGGRRELQCRECRGNKVRMQFFLVYFVSRMLPRHLITVPLHFSILHHSVRRQREGGDVGIGVGEQRHYKAEGIR